MKSRALVVGIATTSALLFLSGCVAEPAPPTGPSDADVLVIRQSMLDATWSASNFDSGRKAAVTDELVAPEQWFDVMTSCLGDGFSTSSMGYSVGLDGYLLSEVDSKNPTQEQLVRWAVCSYRNQIDPVADGLVYSPEQVRYLWNYFQDWLIPCLETHGAELRDLPTWTAFRTQPGGIRWTPYDSVRVASDDSLLMNNDRAPLVAACGAPLGVLDPSAAD